jgi:ATP synthase F1 epsilon subunit
MSENFNLEIISPDKTILKTETNQVTLPAFEGLMTILKDHIPLVTFLRPGIIDVTINNKVEKFYVEEGTVEFFKNNLLILSSSAKNKKDLSVDQINSMKEETRQNINSSIKDKERYILNHKVSTLEEISE